MGPILDSTPDEKPDDGRTEEVVSLKEAEVNMSTKVFNIVQGS